jgi:hypothetical protein
MSKQFMLLLSPVFSTNQVLESAIVDTYLRQAIASTWPNPTILSLGVDTPWKLYNNFALDNTLISPNDPVLDNNPGYALGQQATILSLALSATLVAHMWNSEFVLANMNGPVPNEGFSALLGLAPSFGKPVVYWKDDLRHLWGTRDNPVNLLPGQTKYLFSNAPPGALGSGLNRLNKIDETKPGDCGEEVLPILINSAFVDTTGFLPPGPPGPPPPLPAGYIGSLITIGDQLNNLFAGTTWSAAIDTDPLAVYSALKGVLASNKGLLGKSDQDFLVALA